MKYKIKYLEDMTGGHILRVNDVVYINGYIKTNTYPRGDIGPNDIKQQHATNVVGTIFNIEQPNHLNNYQYLYTVMIRNNLYGIEIPGNMLTLMSNSTVTTNNYFTTGQQVYVSNAMITFLYPTRVEYVKYKVGFISGILPGNLYQITFNNNMIATEVSPNFIYPFAVSTPTYKVSEEAQDISEDENLQENVTNYYLKKTIKWIDKNKEFKNLKKFKKVLETSKGFKHIYKILKKFLVKHKNLKWYDLEDKSNYEDVQDYIRKKLNEIN